MNYKLIRKVQRQLFDCILEQIFFKGIFHADPHPGNVYILRDGTPALLDFGSVGRLGTLQQDAFKRLLIGFERKIHMSCLMDCFN